MLYFRLLTGLGLDAELAPVAQNDARVSVTLSPDEAANHPHAAARATYVRRDGLLELAPAPRFASTPTVLLLPAGPIGTDSRALLQEFGFGPDEVDALLADAVVHQA